MKISVELTLTPLQDNFEPAIIHFIKKLSASNLKVLENPLSTQVYGDYDEVMHVLKHEIKSPLSSRHFPKGEKQNDNITYNSQQFLSLGEIKRGMKIVKSDRYDYEPHF